MITEGGVLMLSLQNVPTFTETSGVLAPGTKNEFFDQAEKSL